MFGRRWWRRGWWQLHRCGGWSWRNGRHFRRDRDVSGFHLDGFPDWGRGWLGTGYGGAGLGHLDGNDFVFADQGDAIVGLDPEHFLLVSDDGSDDFLTVFKRDFFRTDKG